MKPVRVNRAPVLTLWASIVAEAQGHPPDLALALGAAVAGAAARAKARRLGIAEEHGETKTKPRDTVHLMGRDIAPGDQQPAATRAYVERAFGDRLEEVREAMRTLIARVPPDDLDRHAFRLYEAFRPEVPEGTRGWGAKGELHLDRIRDAAC